MTHDTIEFPLIDSAAGMTPAEKKQSFKDIVLAQYAAEEPIIKALAAKYKGVAFDCTTTKGLDQCKAARLELREQGRFKLQRSADETKAEANDLKRIIDSESARLIAIVKPVEDDIDKQIKAEEERKAAEKAKREREAAELRAHHEGKMAQIRACVDRARGLPSERIANGIAQIEGMTFGDDCADFLPQYEAAKADTLTAMRALLTEAQAREAAEAQRLENERVAAELEAQRIALEKQAAELKAQQEAAHAARVAITHAAVFSFPEPEPIARPVAAMLGSSMAALAPSQLGGSIAEETPEAQPPQHVLKATPAMADATARGEFAEASPRVGAMGAGQAADAAPAGEPATIKLGDICTRLGFTMTGAFIETTLGIKAAATDKRALLFTASQEAQIFDALIKHIKAVQAA